ncbi:MAG: hypothetical protein EOO05_04695 [Chitinophagaceae bacterium]|nr:MAG: hypothetical protein EOO05_04695 [Chitinophagaceae bacterium]
MKLFRFILCASVAAVVISCNNDKKTPAGSETTTEPSAASPSTESKPSTTNNIKEYKVTFESDTAILGKSKDLKISFVSATGIALQDPDGKDLGTELNIKMTMTNKGQIGQSSSDHVDYTDSRLQLDNGNNISAETGTDYLRADPESTSKEETWTYKLPAGTKPKSISLFKDGTRVTIGVTMQ